MHSTSPVWPVMWCMILSDAGAQTPTEPLKAPDTTMLPLVATFRHFTAVRCGRRTFLQTPASRSQTLMWPVVVPVRMRPALRERPTQVTGEEPSSSSTQSPISMSHTQVDPSALHVTRSIASGESAMQVRSPRWPRSARRAPRPTCSSVCVSGTSASMGSASPELSMLARPSPSNDDAALPDTLASSSTDPLRASSPAEPAGFPLRR
mmetsp:Transcript_5208/g.13147  ORF Transcript_5208/g.13147 Transcript_5208/m.13147 type:complete len:207 (-) Transcript_5208:1778-2398(-)